MPQPAKKLQHMPRQDKNATHERLVADAADLLYERGLNGSSVDELCRDLGITKPTFYNPFASKDLLIQEVLELRDARRRASFPEFIAQTRGSPQARILAIFDWLLNWAETPDYRGCPLVNAAIEVTSRASQPRQIARAHKAWMRSELERLARQLGYRRPRSLAKGLMILIEGAVLSAYVEDDPSILRDAKSTAKSLLKDYESI